MSNGKDIVPALPDGLSTHEEEVKFVTLECRTCGKRGPWVNVEDRENPVGAFDAHHASETGHKKFYMYSLVRNTAEVMIFRPRKGRRS